MTLSIRSIPGITDETGSTEKEKPLSGEGLKTGRKVLNVFKKRTPLSNRDSRSCKTEYILWEIRRAISFSEVAIKKSI